MEKVGEGAVELGLLFGNEGLSTQEEETDVCYFLHLMLQEFAAAKFISVADRVRVFNVLFFFQLTKLSIVSLWHLVLSPTITYGSFTLHGTGNGTGTRTGNGKNGLLYIMLYCSHCSRTGNGNGTGKMVNEFWTHFSIPDLVPGAAL